MGQCSGSRYLAQQLLQLSCKIRIHRHTYEYNSSSSGRSFQGDEQAITEQIQPSRLALGVRAYFAHSLLHTSARCFLPKFSDEQYKFDMLCITNSVCITRDEEFTLGLKHRQRLHVLFASCSAFTDINSQYSRVHQYFQFVRADMLCVCDDIHAEHIPVCFTDLSISVHSPCQTYVTIIPCCSALSFHASHLAVALYFSQ